jgi:hypothetical protein
LTEDITDPKVQEMWDYVRKDHASVRAAQTLKATRTASGHAPAQEPIQEPAQGPIQAPIQYPLTDDIEGFETWVDYFRRHAVAAIRDRSVQGNEAAVEKGRKLFLLVCEQGINAGERVGNHAYAAMLQRQRDKFRRALSDREAPPSEESGLLPPPPVDPEVAADPGAAARAMPGHELVVRYFASCVAGGMPFYEAMDWLTRPADTPWQDRS